MTAVDAFLANSGLRPCARNRRSLREMNQATDWGRSTTVSYFVGPRAPTFYTVRRV
jgi:hypothetical protein